MLTTDPFDPIDADGDTLHEECGVFGIWGADGASAHVALGLHALQHRGQEAAGMVTFDGRQFHAHRAMGHVAGNFDRDDIIQQLAGRVAIGHNRYSTTGETALRNVQPLFAELASGGFAVAHNGNLSNAIAQRDKLVQRGSIFQSTSDTEVIIHLVATSSHDAPLDRLVDALKQVEGAYSLLCLTQDFLVACRDPLGIRPLVMGKLGEATIFASETVALDTVGATFVREIDPGEMVVVDDHGIKSLRPFAPAQARPCIFEHVYFSRPDSIAEGKSVYEVRKNIGAVLSREAPVEADYVVPVPDSGVPAAIGFAQASGIPFELGIIRSHYVGRTFIQPSQDGRSLGVKLKHNANSALIRGKRVVLIDVAEDRADDARCRCDRSPHAHCLAAHRAQLLLWRRHARALQAPRRPHGRGGHARVHPGRQPRLHLDRRALRGTRRHPRSRRPAALRRLLHRCLPDHADRPAGRRQRPCPGTSDGSTLRPGRHLVQEVQ
jgi:amidophosphoribosyltransferase